MDTKQLRRAKNVFSSTLCFPGLCKSLGVTSPLSKMQSWIALNIDFKSFYSIQGLSLHPRQNISHIYEPCVLAISRLDYFDLLCLKWNVKMLYCSLRIRKAFNHR